MNRVWPWIAGVVVTVLLIILITGGGPGRQARYQAMRGFGRRAAITQSQIDAPVVGALIVHQLAVRQRR